MVIDAILVIFCIFGASQAFAVPWISTLNLRSQHGGPGENLKMFSTTVGRHSASEIPINVEPVKTTSCKPCDTLHAH